MRSVFNRFLAIALCIAVIALCFVLTTAAKAAVISSDACGTNATWTLSDDGTLTISGSGALWDVSSIFQIGWFDMCESITRVVIQDGITHINNYAFYCCSNLKDISIPESVSSFGEYAFAGCQKLTSVAITGPVTKLPRSVFENCTALSSVSLPNTLTTVGESAFYGCSALTQSPLPDSVTTIEADAFSGCTGLTSFVMPASLNTLGCYAFSNCTYMNTVVFGPKLRTIDSYAFLYCHFLTQITFQGNGPSLDSSAFGRISATCYFPENDPTWQGLTSYGYGGTISWVSYVPEKEETVGGICGDDLKWTISQECALIISGTGDMYDFNDEHAPWYDFRATLTSLVAEEGVTGLGNAAFEGCHFTQVSLPSTLKRIGNAAFADCNELLRIDLPASVQTLGNAPFFRCKNLMYVQAAANSPYFTNDAWGVLFNKNKTTLIWASPAALIEVYTIPESVTDLAGSAFYGCRSLTQITLNSKLTELKPTAFANCTRLERITIPAGIADIGMSAFDGCSALQEILFCGDAPNFADYALSGITVKVYYPQNNATWTNVISRNLGGNITWVPCDASSFCQNGHTYGAWFYTLTPRCVIDGLQRRNCIRCAAYEEVTAAATDHIYRQTSIPASEDTVGYDLYTCTGCGEYIISFRDSTQLTRSDAIQQIRYLISEQASEFTVSYYDTVPGSETLAKELYELAAGHGSAPYLGDYLTHHPIHGMTCSGGGYRTEDQRYYNTVRYNMFYTTTYEAEAYVDSAIATILEQLDLDGKSDFEKIKLIHDYVCDNVDYLTSSLTDHTVYGAVKNGLAACQGYALLTYRLMMESGIDCRYISGTANGGPHGWNIVRLGDVYYNIDTTWDDNYGKISYEYFLRSEADFADHLRDAQYATEAFYAAYPMAEGSYFFGSERNLNWILTPDGTLSISGSGYLFDSPCPQYADRVKKLVLDEGIVSISMSAFENHSALTEVTLPKSLNSILFDAFENCTALQSVHYMGYPTDRKNMIISSGNDNLLQATWYCTVCPEEHNHGSNTCDICGYNRNAGDLNKDGIANNEDVVLLLWHTLFPTEYPLTVDTDLNKDGTTNNEDVVLLLWHTLFPQEYPL